MTIQIQGDPVLAWLVAGVTTLAFFAGCVGMLLIGVSMCKDVFFGNERSR